MGARYIDGVFFNVFAVFSIGYLVNTVQDPAHGALWAVSISALVMIFFIPVFGACRTSGAGARPTPSVRSCSRLRPSRRFWR